MQCSQPLPIEPCVPCKHPLEFLFENAYKATLGLENKVSFSEAIDTLLDNGMIFSNCNVCCPDCGIYALASVETFLKFVEAIQFELNNSCCLNLVASIEVWLRYVEAVGISPDAAPVNICCDISFNDCFNKLICWMNNPEGSIDNIQRILEKGLVEYGAFFDNCNEKSLSGLCFISEFLKQNCDLYLGESNAEFIDLLLDRGLVVQCEDDKVFIGSVEAWLKYAEAVGSA